MKLTSFFLIIVFWAAGCNESESAAPIGEITFKSDSSLYHLNGGTAKIRLTVINTTPNNVYYFTSESVRFYGMIRTVISGKETTVVNEFVSPRTNNSFLLTQDPAMFEKASLATAQQFNDEVLLTGPGTRVFKFYYGNTPASVNFTTFLQQTVIIQ
ncbi:MAG: hypothetical protein ACOYNS_06850 [Bacteroidota bacterium]